MNTCSCGHTYSPLTIRIGGEILDPENEAGVRRPHACGGSPSRGLWQMPPSTFSAGRPVPPAGIEPAT